MKVFWIAGGIFTLVGAGMLLGSGALYRSNQRFAASASVAEGVVVNLIGQRSKKSTTYSPEVRFETADGRSVTFTSGTSSSPPAYDRGEKVKVLYQAANPEDARIDSFMETGFGPLLLGGMGLVFGGVGGGMLFWQIRKRRLHAWLAQHGMQVQARFLSVDYDTSLKVNGRSPWRLSCQWQHPVTGTVHLFHSEPIWFDPTAFVSGETLAVKVNADDPRQYLVDLGFLPKSA